MFASSGVDVVIAIAVGGRAGVDADINAVGGRAGGGGGGGVDVDVTTAAGRAGGGVAVPAVGETADGCGDAGSGVDDADITAVAGRAGGGGFDVDNTAVAGRAGGGGSDVTAVGGTASGGGVEVELVVPLVAASMSPQSQVEMVVAPTSQQSERESCGFNNDVHRGGRT